MKKIMCSAFVLFCTIFSYGHNTYLDSLKLDLEKQSNKKIYLYSLLNTETKEYKKAVIGNKLGLIYQYENNLDSARYFHYKALGYAKKVNSNNQEIGVSYNKIGIVHYYKGELDSAIVFFKKAIPFYKDSSLKANSYNNLAMMYKSNSNPDLSIQNYLKAYDIYSALNNNKKRVSILLNLGALYNAQEDFSQAKKYLTKGINIALDNNDKKGEFDCKTNLADAYLIKKDFITAKPIIIEALVYFEKVKIYKSIIVNKNNLASCYEAENQKSKMLNEYLEIIDIIESTGLETNKETIFLNIGSSYYDIKEYNKAVEYSNKGLQFAKSNNIVYLYETAYKQLSEIHLALNQADSSLYYKDLQIALKDSLDLVEKQKKMMELEAKHHNKALTTDLDNTINALGETEETKKSISKLLMISLIVLMILIMGSVLLYKRYQNKKNLSEELAIRNKKNRANISTLESTLEQKDELIEGLSYREETGRLPYPKNLEPLTDREAEVLVGVKDGLKDKEIAERLFLSVSTVRTHLRKAYVKIDARNRAEAIQFITEFEV